MPPLRTTVIFPENQSGRAAAYGKAKITTGVELSYPIESVIVTLRGQRVVIDADQARAYAVSTRALNQAVKRNAERFPVEFMFRLSEGEKAEVVTNCDHLARLSE